MVVIKDETFYTISEVCRMLGVEAHTLRYWEKEFRDFVKPLRNAGGNRVYSQKDIGTLVSIRGLLNVELFTVAGARRQMYLMSSERSA